MANSFFWLEYTFNPLMGEGNYSATSNNMKLIHWPLMGGLVRKLPISVSRSWCGLWSRRRQCCSCCHRGSANVRVHPVHWLIATQRQAAADHQTNRPELWAPPLSCYSLYPPCYLLLLLSPESWCSIYRPTEGRRLSLPRHCSKSVLPAPKAAWRSGFQNKRDSSLCPKK